MTSMIERVARAIFKTRIAARLSLGTEWENLRAELKEIYFLEAKAAIAAMRIPTDDMLRHAVFAQMHGNKEHPIRVAWQAMVDAALSESTET